MKVKSIVAFAVFTFILIQSGESTAQNQFSNPWGQMKNDIVISPITGELSQYWGVGDYWEYHKIMIPVKLSEEITAFNFNAQVLSVGEIVTVIDKLEFVGSSLSDIGLISVWETSGYVGPNNSNDVINGQPLLKLEVRNGDLYLLKGSYEAITASPPDEFSPFNPPSESAFMYGHSTPYPSWTD